MGSVWLMTIAILLSFGIIAHSFDGGSAPPKQQPTLCDELILPAGYPCSEYVVFITFSNTTLLSNSNSYLSVVFLANWRFYFFLNYFQIETKDGFLLGLQRVSSSSSARIRYSTQQLGPPVLLLHGLFMVTTYLLTSLSALNFLILYNNLCSTDTSDRRRRV